MFYIWLVLVFILGAVIGSFLNVCIARLPLEKSLLWPLTSRCGHCLQPVGRWDNIPLVSWWVLRGRCRNCGARFSFQYFLVELMTGLGFAGLFYLILIQNVHQLPAIQQEAARIQWGVIPGFSWVIFAHHALLFSFLMIVGWCDWNRLEIPLSVTLTGTFVGLVFGTIWPWPWPNQPMAPMLDPARVRVWNLLEAPPIFRGALPVGALQPWPFWWPLPEWFANGGNWQTGLANGFLGMLAGTVLLRAVRFIFTVGRGVEGLGLGDADLMMMAGAFLGWQPMLFAFFISVFFALPFGILKWIVTREQGLPFGPALAAAVLLAGLRWEAIAGEIRFFFFWRDMLLALAGAGALFLFLAAVLFRLLRGRPEQSAEDLPAKPEKA
jgi:leader peptidase (prepilin peptidase)/N-methyltransferase